MPMKVYFYSLLCSTAIGVFALPRTKKTKGIIIMQQLFLKLSIQQLDPVKPVILNPVAPCSNIHQKWNWYSLISEETSYGLDDHSLFTCQTQDFTLFHHTQISSASYSGYYPKVMKGFLLQTRQLQYKAGQSSSFISKTEKIQSSTSTALCLISYL
jgi:hypothetical protein